MKENFRKSGIYMISSNFKYKIYIGRSVDLGYRFRDYLSENYLKKNNCVRIKNKSIIYSALLKGGYNNFEIYILEYCDKNSIVIKEQHYIDLLKPEFNILKKAGPSLRSKNSYCKKAIKVVDKKKVKI